jgi:hypothetical protein
MQHFEVMATELNADSEQYRCVDTAYLHRCTVYAVCSIRCNAKPIKCVHSVGEKVLGDRLLARRTQDRGEVHIRCHCEVGASAAELADVTEK